MTLTLTMWLPFAAPVIVLLLWRAGEKVVSYVREKLYG